MTRKLPQINNQDGFLMIMALLIMATLAIAGLLATKDAVMESRVGLNYAVHKQCEASAEAAAKEVIQAINSTFIDPTVSSTVALGTLGGKAWTHDGYNTEFDFDSNNWSSYNSRPSVLLSNLGYLNSAGAIAVLIDQTTSVLTPGLSSSHMPDHFEYIIYCRAEHVRASNSAIILALGYMQEKI